MITKVAEEVMVASIKAVYYNITRAIVCKPTPPQPQYDLHTKQNTSV